MNHKFQQKSYTGIWMLAFTFLIHQLFKSFPSLCEAFYGQILYPSIRIASDLLTVIVPFPVVYLLVILLIYFLVRWVVNARNLRYSWLRVMFSTINFWAWIISIFYIAWGFNYDRPHLKDKLGLEISKSDIKSKEILFHRTLSSIKQLPYLRMGLSDKIDCALAQSYQSTQKDLLESLGYSITGNPGVKRIIPPGILRRLGISGIYIPFAAQGHVDASLLNFEFPFIAAHELSHANGITDEGEASLVAYLTCMNSENDTLKYSAQLYLIRNLLYHAQFEDSLLFEEWLNLVPPKVKSDINRIKDNAAQYPDIFPILSDRINDVYLKANGIESGSKSYGDLIDLIIAIELRN